MNETPEQTMRRMILAILSDGPHGNGFEGEDLPELDKVLSAEYKRAGMDFDWRLPDKVLRSLIAGRRVKLTHSKWESGETYTLAPKKPRKKDLALPLLEAIEAVR